VNDRLSFIFMALALTADAQTHPCDALGRNKYLPGRSDLASAESLVKASNVCGVVRTYAENLSSQISQARQDFRCLPANSPELDLTKELTSFACRSRTYAPQVRNSPNLDVLP
jgi:hypothetical protein